MRDCGMKCLNHLKQNVLLNNIQATNKYAFGILKEIFGKLILKN
jgi:hypothetical protein